MIAECLPEQGLCNADGFKLFFTNSLKAFPLIGRAEPQFNTSSVKPNLCKIDFTVST